MLGGQPFADMVSSNHSPTRELWIRRVLVRAQEGQLEARYHDEWCRASCVLALSLPPEPLEAVREFRISVTLVRELGDEQRERLGVTGDP